jgi:transcriptional regulator with XRE-family HTH domain
MEITKAVGKTIRDLRTERSLSQEDLADLTNLHRTYISSVERGKRNISIKNLEKIAKALKVKISNILVDSGN